MVKRLINTQDDGNTLENLIDDTYENITSK